MRILRTFGLQLAIAGAYVGAGKLGLLVPAGHQIITLVWAPTGIALAAVLLFGYRILPALVAGALLTNLTAGASPAVACAIAVGNPLEAALGAFLLRRVNFRIALDRTRDVLALVFLAAGLSTVASATTGVCALWATSQLRGDVVARNWLDWWLGDAMGDLIVAPLLLTLASLFTDVESRRFVRRPLEALALTVVIGAVSAAVFLVPASRHAGQEIAFVVFPLLIAAALRFGPPGAAVASLLTVAVALAGTLLTRGPFGDLSSRAAIAQLHLFMGTAGVSAMLFAASLAEREAAQEELRRSEERSRHAWKMEALGHLASGIAHEFNNLLTVIRGHASILETKITLDDARRSSVEEISKAAERASEATRRILAFGRRDDGVPVVLDLQVAIRGLVPVLTPLLSRKITLRLELEPRLPCVRIDPGMLEQAVLNLVLNARDALPRGGRVTIRARRSTPQTSAGESCCVELSVIDTGDGMDEATRRRLFEPYFTTKPRGKGSGLGLAMVHGIVTRAGGSADVWSEPGRGSVFTIRLPADLHSIPPKPEPRSVTPGSGGRETILVVEDEETVRLVVRDTLTARGYEILAASNGPDALQLFRLFPGRISLLLTDVDLPSMPGAEVASRAMLERPGLRLLFMSGHSQAVLDQAGIDPSRILLKPFSPEALATRVRQELDACGSAQAIPC